MRRIPSLLVLPPLLLACGAAPPPAAPLPPPPPVAVAPPPPPPDLSAVADPATLVVTGRAAKLSASLAAAHAWTRLPMPQSEQLTELLTTEAVGPVVDLDQPVDFAVSVAGSGMRMRPQAAASAAVKDPDKVKASLSERYKLVPGDNGTTLIEGLGRKHPGGDDDDDSDGRPDMQGGGDDAARTCELAAAYGAAPVRIVCATSRKALGELGPWLTRTATRAASTADLHLDVSLSPVKPLLEQQKRFAGPVIAGLLGSVFRGQAARSLLGALAGDLADFGSDLDGLSLDVNLTDAGSQGEATLQLSGTSSVIGRLAAGHPERSGPPPAAFWQLPADADLAVFERGVDDTLLAPGRDLLIDAIASGLTDQGVAAGDVKAIDSALAKLLPGAPAVYASGLDAAAVRKAIGAESALGVDADPAARVEAKRTTAELLLGWHLLEVDTPPATLNGALRELAAAAGRPAVAAAIRAHDKDTTPAVLRSAPIAKTAGLPAGATHWVIELGATAHHGALPKGKKPPPVAKPLWVHLFVAGDAQHTWVAFSGDEAGAAAKLASALGGAGDKLSGRADLAPLKDAKVGMAGFLGGRALPETALEALAVGGGSSSSAGRGLDDVDQMPNKGKSPIIFSVTARPGGPPAVAVGSLTIPRGSIEDLVAAVLKHGGF